MNSSISKYFNLNLKELVMKSQSWVSSKNRLYLFLRTDLPLAQQTIQACHALLELARAAPIDEHPSFIFFEAKDSAELLAQRVKISSAGIKTFPFSEPYSDWGITAFACELTGEDQRDHFKQFKLWRKAWPKTST